MAINCEPKVSETLPVSLETSCDNPLYVVVCGDELTTASLTPCESEGFIGVITDMSLLVQE